MGLSVFKETCINLLSLKDSEQGLDKWKNKAYKMSFSEWLKLKPLLMPS